MRGNLAVAIGSTLCIVALGLKLAFEMGYESGAYGVSIAACEPNYRLAIPHRTPR